MAKTRRSRIAHRIERALTWLSTFGVTAVLMYFLKQPQSAWLGWFTFVSGVIAVVATTCLFHQGARDKMTTFFWRKTKKA